MQKSLIAAAVAACALAAVSAPALAASPERVESKVEVAVDRAAFSDPRAVDALYAKLRRAARVACYSRNEFDREIMRQDAACAAQALNRTVAQIDRPALMARHQSAGGAMLATGY